MKNLLKGKSTLFLVGIIVFRKRIVSFVFDTGSSQTMLQGITSNRRMFCGASSAEPDIFAMSPPPERAPELKQKKTETKKE